MKMPKKYGWEGADPGKVVMVPNFAPEVPMPVTFWTPRLAEMKARLKTRPDRAVGEEEIVAGAHGAKSMPRMKVK